MNAIVALLYDFDKTLCTTDMEDYAFIRSGLYPAGFGEEANDFGQERTAWTAFWRICTP